jgi:hypothetical protein
MWTPADCITIIGCNGMLLGARTDSLRTTVMQSARINTPRTSILNQHQAAEVLSYD